jgi:hypothetical protein
MILEMYQKIIFRLQVFAKHSAKCSPVPEIHIMHVFFRKEKDVVLCDSCACSMGELVGMWLVFFCT